MLVQEFFDVGHNLLVVILKTDNSRPCGSNWSRLLEVKELASDAAYSGQHRDRSAGIHLVREEACSCQPHAANF